MLIRSVCASGCREDDQSGRASAVNLIKCTHWDRDRKRLLVLFAFVVVEIQRVDKVAEERETFVA
jgi:hypothetical protein